MQDVSVEGLREAVTRHGAVRAVGRVRAVEGGVIRVSGLARIARVGDRLSLVRDTGAEVPGEVLKLSGDMIEMLPDDAVDGVGLDDRVRLLGSRDIAPCDAWIGRVIDPFGRPLDERPLPRGPGPRALRTPPPAPARRKALGARLETGLRVFNTLLPIVCGQRIGLFAGSGVGKSSLLAHFARALEADVVVIALVGERGRELRDFVETVLGADGMARAVVVAATSDQPAVVRRRCAWAAMCVAEHFRDQGRHVVFLADSVTRFAEAHREVATAAGEAPVLRGYPASTAHAIMALCERAGPGPRGAGDITAVFTVLVAGSDMEEPVADILRGVLDGHVVLERAIAERGRYPAIDLLRSVSRSLPGAASAQENALIAKAREALGTYARSETMIRAGLYAPGNDAELDGAVEAWPALDAFLAEPEPQDARHSFDRLALLLRRTMGATAAGSTTVAAPGTSAAVAGFGRAPDMPGG